MNREIAYTKTVDQDHIKSYGQYFTQDSVAEFMCFWACRDARTMLDPAVGNSVFLSCARALYPACALTGYEIDPVILDYFKNPAGADIRNEDYLLSGWEEKYDAIVCNPPYNRFQAVSNRNDIIEEIYAHTGKKYSNYTNLYILFLLKSIFQLNENGRLAYIIPTEFLNSRYGTPIKEMMLREKLLCAVINFSNNSEMFFNATTTCCILLLEKAEHQAVSFYNLSSVEELEILKNTPERLGPSNIAYSELAAGDKWRAYLNQEEISSYRNLTDVSQFCKISRGIATGDNEFFCMSRSKIGKYGLPESEISACVCRSADVKTNIFSREDFDALAAADKTVYLLDIHCDEDGYLRAYIRQGEVRGIHEKHLLSGRTPWYSMEKKPIAPIWVTSNCRGSIKFARNLAGVKSLTTFHSIFVHEEYADLTDVIFCYFLTPVAQTIIRENRKELGNGLEKFQPGDLNSAKMLDVTLLTTEDRAAVEDIYGEMLRAQSDDQTERLNRIFSRYLSD